MARLRTQTRGFTLLELVLVLVLISVTLAIAAPTLRGFRAGRRMDEAATDLLSVLRAARSLSISNGRIYRLQLQGDQYQLYAYDPGDPSLEQQGSWYELGNETGRVFVLPPDTTLTMTRFDAPSLNYIDFYPSGRADMARFEIGGQQGLPICVQCDSPTESYRILTAQEMSQ